MWCSHDTSQHSVLTLLICSCPLLDLCERLVQTSSTAGTAIVMAGGQQVGPELTERLHAAAAAQSDESRTLYYLPHMQVSAPCAASPHVQVPPPAHAGERVQRLSRIEHHIGRLLF